MVSSRANRLLAIFSIIYKFFTKNNVRYHIKRVLRVGFLTNLIQKFRKKNPKIQFLPLLYFALILPPLNFTFTQFYPRSISSLLNFTPSKFTCTQLNPYRILPTLNFTQTQFYPNPILPLPDFTPIRFYPIQFHLTPITFQLNFSPFTHL